jgi:hypothetical protein
MKSLCGFTLRDVFVCGFHGVLYQCIIDPTNDWKIGITTVLSLPLGPFPTLVHRSFVFSFAEKKTAR